MGFKIFCSVCRNQVFEITDDCYCFGEEVMAVMIEDGRKIRIYCAECENEVTWVPPQT